MIRLPGVGPNEIPVLETARLRLRGHRLSDFETSKAMWAQAQTARHISGTPSTPAESWTRMTRFLGMWSLLGFSYWYVEEKANGRFVGEVGFGDFMRDIKPDIHGLPEIGWVLSPDQGGKGYATEAAMAALAWGDTHFGDSPTVCIIKVDNTPSIRVAEKCGFTLKTETQFNGAPTLLFERRP